MKYKFFLKYYTSKYILNSLYILSMHYLPSWYLFGTHKFTFLHTIKALFPLFFWSSLIGKIYVTHYYFISTSLTNILYKIPSMLYIIFTKIPMTKKKPIRLLINIMLLLLFIMKTKAWIYTIPWICNIIFSIFTINKKTNIMYEIWLDIWLYNQIGTIIYGYLNGFLHQSYYSSIIAPIIVEKIFWTALCFISTIVMQYITVISNNIACGKIIFNIKSQEK